MAPRRPPPGLALAVAAALSAGCGAGRATLVDVLLTSSVAVGAAAERRAAGDCYVPCEFGTACNPSTGTCERLPCGGACPPGEICVESGGGDRCEPMPIPDLSVQRPGDPPPPPFRDGPPAPPAP